MSESKQITLTYLNIRQSIAILISKLVVIDLILAAIIIGFYYLLVEGDRYISGLSANSIIFLSAFGIVGIFKTILTGYVVLRWLNEYYEVTPEYIIHKHGLVFKKQEHYRLDHVRRMDVQDSFLGELFNFGTITLFDIRFNKYLDLYLIHNARRYAKVLKALLPHLEVKEDHVWNPLIKDEDIAPVREAGADN